MWLVNIMFVVLVGFIVIIICRGVNNRNLATMAWIMTIFSIVNIIIGTFSPVLKYAEVKNKELQEYVEKYEKVDKVKDNVKDKITKELKDKEKSFWKTLTEFPLDNNK